MSATSGELLAASLEAPEGAFRKTIREIERVAAAFKPTSATLLKSRALLRRADTKFVIPVEQVPYILAAVSADYTLLVSNGETLPDYQTLYFDSPSLSMFHAHRRGRRPRYKVRVRHHVARARTYLERKCKGPNGQTAKTRFERDFGDTSSRAVKTLTPVPCLGQDDDLVPTAWTNFQRITLVGTTWVERVTIDLNLRLESADSGASVALSKVAIIEVKQPRVDRKSPIQSLLRQLHHRPFSISKYCLAVCLLRPDVRHSGFEPQLHHLRRIAP